MAKFQVGQEIMTREGNKRGVVTESRDNGNVVKIGSEPLLLLQDDEIVAAPMEQQGHPSDRNTSPFVNPADVPGITKIMGPPNPEQGIPPMRNTHTTETTQTVVASPLETTQANNAGFPITGHREQTSTTAVPLNEEQKAKEKEIRSPTDEPSAPSKEQLQGGGQTVTKAYGGRGEPGQTHTAKIENQSLDQSGQASPVPPPANSPENKPAPAPAPRFDK